MAHISYSIIRIRHGAEWVRGKYSPVRCWLSNYAEFVVSSNMKPFIFRRLCQNSHTHTYMYMLSSQSLCWLGGGDQAETTISTICCQIAEMMADGEIPRNSLSPTHHCTCHLVFCYHCANSQWIFLSKSLPTFYVYLSIKFEI